MGIKDVATKQDIHEYIHESEKRTTKRIKASEIKILSELQKMREENSAHQFSHSLEKS